MREEQFCPECGTELPAGGDPAALCPACLLKVAMAEMHDPESGTYMPSSAVVDAPLRHADEPPGDSDALLEDEDLPKTVGPYRTVRLLGQGGMAVVFLAEQMAPIRRRVAVKVIKAGMDTRQVIARFESERQALALMSHPNIAKVFDAGATDDGRPYFAMEYVPGSPITHYCDQFRLTTDRRLSLFLDVVDAIQHAHQKGIIHRDIKPSNVLVGIEADRPVAKVIDFGIAKAIERRLTERSLFTEQGMLIGTPEYMSPEQAALTPHDVDTRTDIYSLGVLLYELLVGALPLDPRRLREAAIDEVLQVIREEDPQKLGDRLTSLGDTGLKIADRRRTDLGSLLRKVRGDLSWITLKALEKDRARRYATPSELAGDIRRYLSDEPIVARPPSTGYRVRKFAEKHRGPVAAIASMVVTVLTLGSLALWQGLEAQGQAAIARRQALEMRINAILQTAGSVEDPTTAALLLVSLDDSLALWHTADSVCGPTVDSATGLPDPSFATLIASRVARRPIASVIARHGNQVSTVEFSPDSRSVISASWDGTARISAVDGRGQPTVLAENGGRVLAVAFSPDGNRVATAGDDLAVRVWSADGIGDPILLEGHQGPTSTLAFSPDGSHVASGSTDGTARVWSLDGNREPVILKGHSRIVWTVAFSPGGGRVLTTSGDGTARVWRADGGEAPVVLEGHEDQIIHGAFSPDGQRVATASLDDTARIWNTDGSGTPIVFRGNGGWVETVAFDPKGHRMVAAGADGAARIWNVDGSDGAIVIRGFGRRDGRRKAMAMFSPDGRQVLHVSLDDVVRVWNAEGIGEPVELAGHSGDIMWARINADGTHVATASRDGTARVWDLACEREPLVMETSRSSLVWAAFDPSGQRDVMRLDDGTAQIFRVDGSGPPIVLAAPPGSIRWARFDHTGDRILTSSADNTARVWSAADGVELMAFRGHNSSVQAAALSTDGLRVVTGSNDDTARIWSVETGEVLVILEGHRDDVTGVAFSPDGQLVATSSRDRTVRVWDVDGEQVMILNGHSDSVSNVAFSPDGCRVVSASWDGTARIWTLDESAAPVVLRGHGDLVWDAAFNPQGNAVVTASNDQTARVWNSDGSGQPVILEGHSHRVLSATFRRDGARVLTASFDGTARIWRVSWDELIDYLRSKTTVCLTIQQRERFLAESPVDAMAAYTVCEASFGRIAPETR